MDKIWKFLKSAGGKALSITVFLGSLAGILSYCSVAAPDLSAKCAGMSIRSMQRESEYPDARYIECEIRNSGTVQATGVRLTVPARISQAQCKGEPCMAEGKNVDIAFLRPDSSVKVFLWCEHFYADTNEFKLNSKESVGKVYVGEFYYLLPTLEATLLDGPYPKIILALAFAFLIIAFNIPSKNQQ